MPEVNNLYFPSPSPHPMELIMSFPCYPPGGSNIQRQEQTQMARPHIESRLSSRSSSRATRSLTKSGLPPPTSRQQDSLCGSSRDRSPQSHMGPGHLYGI